MNQAAATTHPLLAGRLRSIDMLRGIAALSVVFFHAYDKGIFQPGPIFSWWQTIILFPISYGYVGVYLFFVISGFCIHFKWAKAKAAHRELPNVDFVEFWKRRIRRLYPAYLAALVLYIVILYYQGELVFSSFFWWDTFLHLFMLHNLSVSSVYSLNGAFWSLATEEQLYLAYFLLLWCRIRWGWTKTLLLCFGMRFVWFALGFVTYRLFKIELVFTASAAATWCIWALGALCVEWHLGIVTLPAWMKNKWSICAAFALPALLAYVDFIGPQSGLAHRLWGLLLQPLWGIASFMLLAWLTSREKWLAQSKYLSYLVWLGLISYSLYLIHEAVFRVTPLGKLSSIVLCVIAAAGFFYCFERPVIKQPEATRAGHSPLATANRVSN